MTITFKDSCNVVVQRLVRIGSVAQCI